MTIETIYLTTDFDLKSKSPIQTLRKEFGTTCIARNYVEAPDGTFHEIINSSLDGTEVPRKAEEDILAIIEAIHTLSPTAKAELAACDLREFNIGFDCGDTWSYLHTLPAAVVQAIADVDCSLAFTLYPLRNSDGTVKER